MWHLASAAASSSSVDNRNIRTYTCTHLLIRSCQDIAMDACMHGCRQAGKKTWEKEAHIRWTDGLPISISSIYDHSEVESNFIFAALRTGGGWSRPGVCLSIYDCCEHSRLRGCTHVRIKGQNLNFYLDTHATTHNIYFIRLRILPRFLVHYTGVWMTLYLAYVIIRNMNFNRIIRLIQETFFNWPVDYFFFSLSIHLPRGIILLSFRILCWGRPTFWGPKFLCWYINAVIAAACAKLQNWSEKCTRHTG